MLSTNRQPEPQARSEISLACHPARNRLKRIAALKRPKPRKSLPVKGSTPAGITDKPPFAGIGALERSHMQNFQAPSGGALVALGSRPSGCQVEVTNPQPRHRMFTTLSIRQSAGIRSAFAEFSTLSTVRRARFNQPGRGRDSRQSPISARPGRGNSRNIRPRTGHAPHP